MVGLKKYDKVLVKLNATDLLEKIFDVADCIGLTFYNEHILKKKDSCLVIKLGFFFTSRKYR